MYLIIYYDIKMNTVLYDIHDLKCVISGYKCYNVEKPWWKQQIRNNNRNIC